MASQDPNHPVEIPQSAVTRLTRPVVAFMHVESASGVVLLLCTVAALIAANSGFAETFEHFWHYEFTIGFEGFGLTYPLHFWINDALMAIFFFVVGLEVKREMVHCELREPTKVVLPVAAATGGAVVPALIYVMLVGVDDAEALRGWAVPMATDIAFVVGTLAIIGKGVPNGLKIFLLTLAIVDDIMAVAVIAVFYSTGVQVAFLLAAFAGFLLIFALQRLGVRSIGVYGIVGFVIWVFTIQSGIHPTIAGVFLGLVTPAREWLNRDRYAEVLERAREWLGTSEETTHDFHRKMRFYASETISPLERLETGLHPWVAFVIMPIFALANAGVPIHLHALADPVATASMVGLVLGKPIGIFFVSFLVVKLGMAQLPEGVNWPIMLGAGFLGGIGFTMSLFIAALAFEGEHLVSAKTGVLFGSGISAVVGFIIVFAMTRRSTQTSA